jgi:outer membrane protein TolC
MKKTMDRYLRSLDYYDHSRLPEFNLVGAYSGISGKEDERSRSYTLDEKEYYGGFEISYAFGDTAADAEYEKARVQIESIREEIRSKENSWRMDMQNKVSAIGSYREMARLKESTLEALQSRYATENVKYRQSRLDLQYLLDTYNSILSEKINLANMRYQLIALDIDYRNLTQ